ncbi:MAG: HesA/MoeB/ThiF family protein [Muribaculaceae bacterium]|nr:HesA/MoeB/ThiF family protein [Muribaculaceae bacterium]
MKKLSKEESERYKAHLSLCEIDLPGQQRLRQSRIAVVGAGALASAALLYLAAAGVGMIRVIDGDTVSLSNLQRQIIHSTQDIGLPKPQSAAAKIAALNPDVDVEPVCRMLDADCALQLLADVDVVLDCTDNYDARVLVSDTCVELGKPLCFAALSRFDGQVMTHMPGTAHYRTVFPAPPTREQLECRSCAVSGVLNALAGIAGSMQAAEAIKIIIGAGDLLTDRMVLIDALTFTFREVRLKN